jgi:hypothetical protein
MNTGSVQDQLLAEQRAYYSALAPQYLDQGLDLPGGAPVTFVEADLFGWEPDRRYDVVFMGFWLSHVPAERFGSFWELIAAVLAPRGRVFFADDGYRTPDELIEGPASSTIQRRTPDGTAYRIVKVPHEPADLERQLRSLGWDITVTPTAGPVFWGAGNQARSDPSRLSGRRVRKVLQP